MKTFIILFLSLLSISLCDEVYPGLRFGISNKALSKISSNLLPFFLNTKNITIPDIDINKHLDFIGTVALSITNNHVKLDKVTPEQFKFAVLQDKSAQIEIAINNVKGINNFDYDFKTGFYNSTGTGYFTVDLSLVFKGEIIAVENQVSKTKLGPGMVIKDIELKMLNFDINFSTKGNLERLVKFFVVNLKTVVTSMFKTYVVNQKDQINVSLKNYFASLSLSIPLFADLFLDYSLVKSPSVINQQILDLSFDATIRSSDSDFSGKPYTMPEITATSKDVDLYINQYITDSLIYNVYKKNILNFYIPSEKAPLGLLDTTYISAILPGVGTLYGMGKKIDLQMTSYQQPKLEFKENYAKLDVYYDIAFIVRLDDKNETFLTTKAALTSKLNVFVKDGVVTATIKSLQLVELKVIQQTAIGEINLDSLKLQLDMIVQMLISYVDSIFSQIGIPIPEVLGISFKKAEASFHEGYTVFAMDAEVTPNSLLTLQ
jgi:hypothetical protein